MRHLREFITRVAPWPSDGDDGFVNVHWKRRGSDGRFYWGGRAARTPEEFEKAVGWAQSKPDILDMYICMSRQSDAVEKMGANGFRYRDAVRAANRAVCMKSLFIDVDVKEGAYASTGEALGAVKAMIAAHALPPPSAVVASGSGGAHVHWTLPEPLPPAEWQRLADALARLADASGLLYDRQCTVDAARIMRLPGTRNFKLDPPSEVKLLALGGDVDPEAMRRALEPFMRAPATTQVMLPPRGGRLPDAVDDLGAGVTGAAPVPSVEDLGRVCGFVGKALLTGGEDYPNPLWMLTTYVAAFTAEGRVAAHRMAKGHPGYAEADTDALYDRMEKRRAETDSGWPRCETIERNGCADCAACPLRKADKTPFHFAVPQAAANDKPVDLMPPGYLRGKDGKIYRLHTDAEGIPQPPKEVMPYPVIDGWLQEDPWVLHFTSVPTGGRPKKVEIPLEVIPSKEGVPKALARHGLPLSDAAGKAMREFVVAWIQKLQSIKEAVVSSTPFGWSTGTNGKVEGFTFASKVIGDGWERPAALPDPSLALLYTPKGEIGPWVTAAKIITDQKRPGLDAILAAAFGAPLVRFTGQSGVMMNVYSPESGIGKTTTMRVAQAVWADPVRAMQSLNDTPNSVINKIGELRALPMFWDELKTEADTNRFVVMAFQLTQGKERSRLNADITQRMPGTWQTMLVSASNDSLIEPIAAVVRQSTAGLFRTFEYQVAPGSEGQIETGVVSRAVGLLNDNYGHAGLVYAGFLGREHVRIAREVAELQDDITRAVAAGNDERFWVAVIAVVLAGARYANELRLTEIDEEALRGHMLDVLERMRGEVRAAPSDMGNKISVSSILAQFMKATRARHTLVTNRMHVGRGRPSAKQPIQILGDTSRLEAVHVHIGRDNGLMRISSAYFSEWMADRKYSRHAFTRALKEQFGVHETYGRLGSGTEYVSPTEYIIEINLNEPALKGLLGDFDEEETEETATPQQEAV